MKRIISMLLVIVMITALFTGCGSSKGGKASNAGEAVKQLKDMKGYDLKLQIDRDEDDITGYIKLGIRENGISVGMDIKAGEDKVKIDNAFSVIDNKFFFNVKGLMGVAKENDAEFPEEVQKVLDLLGDYVAVSLPEEFSIGKLQYTWVDIFRKVLVAGLEKGTVDGNNIVVNADNVDKIIEAVLDELGDDILAAVDKTLDEYTSIDYMKALNRMIDGVPQAIDGVKDIIKDLKDAGIIDDDAADMLDLPKEKLEEIKEQLYDLVEQLTGTRSDAEINKYIQDSIKDGSAELRKELKNFLERIKDYPEIDKSDVDEVKIKVTADNGEVNVKLTVEGEGEASLIFKDDAKPLKAPEIKRDFGESSAIILGVGILAPSYLKYINKARTAADSAMYLELMNAASLVAADVDVNVDTGTCFVITAQGGEVSLQVSNVLDNSAYDAWVEVCGGDVFQLGNKEYKNMTFVAAGVVLDSGAVEWYYSGDTDLLDDSDLLKNKFVGSID